MRATFASLALALVAGTWAAEASGAPGRISVGLSEGAPAEEVAQAVAAATGGELVEDLGPLRALVVAVPDTDAAVAAARALPGIEYVEPVENTTRSLVFLPNDPLVGRQWYLSAIRAFDRWPAKPSHPPVLVAVVDSGIDAGHPEFQGRIAGMRSFVSSPPTVDRLGHGTLIAGEIAAALDNVEGIAGAGISAQLLVAKVVARPGQEISVLREAKAIRWAVDRGAKVINLSLGGPRDPNDPDRDTYSALEHSAIDYATRKGVVVVAAVGNCTEFVCPERYAGYPAALPHVIGVSALARDGSTPAFSNRDRVHNDVAAPGTDILSTYPRSLSHPDCPLAGYTDCALAPSRRNPLGTSFSAPLAAAAAAVLVGEGGLLGLGPLDSSQITSVLERSAVDLVPPGRDSRSGYGRLDVNAALDSLARFVPVVDRFEANDDAGARAHTLRGRRRTVEATLDRFEDVRDVYRLWLRAGRRAVFRLAGPAGGNSNLHLWRPGTARITGASRRIANRVAASARSGSTERIAYRPRRSGWYSVEVFLAAGRSGPYRLGIEKR